MQYIARSYKTVCIFYGMNFKTNLKKARKSQGLTQSELATRIGLSQEQVACYEKGIRTPTLDKLAKLAQSLGLTYDELLGTIPPEKASNQSAPNTREKQMQSAFQKLSDNDQRFILKQVKALTKD